jgi:hypothetical protein
MKKEMEFNSHMDSLKSSRDKAYDESQNSNRAAHKLSDRMSSLKDKKKLEDKIVDQKARSTPCQARSTI